MDDIINDIRDKIHNGNEPHHYAVFIKSGNFKKIKVMGQNYPICSSAYSSIHAEHDALKKLLAIKSKEKKVDLIVIRLSKTGILGPSKPCELCINRLNNVCKKKNIIINNVFYSSDSSNIENEKFCNLVSSDDKFKTSGERFKEKSKFTKN